MHLRLDASKIESWTPADAGDDKDGSATSTSGSVDQSVAKSRVYSDVWYRRFLKPLTAQTHQKALSLREAFKLRVLQPTGIPVEEVAGFHEMIRPTHLHLSPMIGVLFTYNNFIDNLYRYGDPDEPAVVLVKALFHVLPGGDIQATHLGSAAGSHLSPDLVGRILEGLESLRPTLAQLDREEGKLLLRDLFLEFISEHSEYQESRNALLKDIEAAEAQLEALNVRDAQSKSVREKIKSLEGMIIKKGRHKIRDLQSELKKLDDDEARAKVQEAIAQQQAKMDETNKQIDELRSEIVTSLDFKTARKAFRRAQEMVELEQDGRVQLVSALVNSIYAYELDSSPSLPMFTTTTILLAFMWRKYDSIHHLKGYMESMARMGALRTAPQSLNGALEEVPSSKSVTTSHSLGWKWRPNDWTAKDKATAAVVTIRKPGTARRPPVVQFSYIRWADYSEFPDCGETALRNLFNQLLYNPDTGAFDHALLTELRDQFYPSLNPKLVDFYQKSSNPADATDHAISKAWIDVVSELNTPDSSSPTVRYRREHQQQNIASPLSNVLCVVSALFGVEAPNDVCLHEIVHRINQLRGWNIQVDTTGIKTDGFGIVGLVVDYIRYELQSYKPVHFGFVQAETLDVDRTTSRSDYDAFRRLFKYSNQAVSVKQSVDAASEFERLALSSLFVPYSFLTKKHGGFLERFPAHYRLLFADLYQSTQQAAVLSWASSQSSQNPYLPGYIDRILNYKEPTFLPPSSN
jgi:hypothetical protein